MPSTIFSALAAGVLATTGVTVVAAGGERAEATGAPVTSSPAVRYAQPALAAAVLPAPAPNALIGAQLGGGAPEAAVPGAEAVEPSGTLITFIPTGDTTAPTAQRSASAATAGGGGAADFTPEVLADAVARTGGDSNTEVTVMVAGATGALQVTQTTLGDLPGAIAGLLGDIGGRIPVVSFFVRNGTIS
ncbi:MAG: hypothetical protein HY997_11645, partial [Mycolicibacterium neoaurum]|nr:hypothetical protein [Mycolicibacterium neoaurum]